MTPLILLEIIPQIPLNFDELTNSWVAYTHINLYVILDFLNKDQFGHAVANQLQHISFKVETQSGYQLFFKFIYYMKVKCPLL